MLVRPALTLIFLLVFAFVGTGCDVARTTAGVSGPAEREARLKQAEAGDPQAQYGIGRSHCCENGSKVGKRDLATALRWLCRAGRQDFAPAQFLIGRVIAGDFGEVPSERTLPLSPESRRTVAAMWFSRAAEAGVDRAGARTAGLRKDMTPSEEEVLLALGIDWRNAPCESEDL